MADRPFDGPDHSPQPARENDGACGRASSRSCRSAPVMHAPPNGGRHTGHEPIPQVSTIAATTNRVAVRRVIRRESFSPGLAITGVRTAHRSSGGRDTSDQTPPSQNAARAIERRAEMHTARQSTMAARTVALAQGNTVPVLRIPRQDARRRRFLIPQGPTTNPSGGWSQTRRARSAVKIPSA